MVHNPAMFSMRVPCSPEQLDVIEDHLIHGKELGMLPDERAWMMAQVRKVWPHAVIHAADLQIETGEWECRIDRRNQGQPKKSGVQNSSL